MKSPTISLVIDHREHKITEHESIKALDPIVKALDIGDVSINIGEIALLFERKTIDDLYASLVDGRFKEQKERSASYNMMYIIEGSNSYLDESSANQKQKMITGSVINTMVRDRIPIVFTKDVNETVQFICCLWTRVVADPMKYVKEKGGEGKESSSYIHTLAPSIKKKENVDPTTCFILQLACIPGISTKKAKVIVETMAEKTMAQFCSSVSAAKASGQKPEVFFKSVPGIGKGLAKTIYEYCG